MSSSEIDDAIEVLEQGELHPEAIPHPRKAPHFAELATAFSGGGWCDASLVAAINELEGARAAKMVQ